VLIILGAAAFIGWNIDLAAVAGILVAVGTGVDDQIVITDEVYGRRKQKTYLNWKDKLKRAFVIIMAAYFTTVVAMLPLFWAGAGALKGFALTSILGVTIGVFVTRPAFAVAIEALLKKDEE
ncbi:MAG: protein translocase subunit SecD, partial [Nanoarchaeota archaeon]